MRPGAAARALVLVCVTGTGHFLAVGMVQPLVSLYAAALGASPVLVGLIMSSFGFIPMFLAIPMGAVTDRVHPRLMITAGAVGTVAGLLLLATAGDYAAILVAYTLLGCAHVLSLVAAQSYVAAVSTPATRDSCFGYYGSGTSVGSTAAPALAGAVVAVAGRYGVSGLAGYRLAFTFAVALALVPAIVAFLLPQPEAKPRPVPVAKSLPKLLRSAGMRLTFIATFVHIAALAARLSFYPLYLTAVGYSPAAVGVIFSVHSAAALLVRPFLGVIVRVWRREAVFQLAMLMLVLASITIPLVPNWGFQLLNVLVAGVANGIIQPLTIALVAASCSAGEQGMGMGLRFVVNRLAVVVAPAAFGVAASAFGMVLAFPMTGAALLGLLALTGRRALGPGRSRPVAT